MRSSSLTGSLLALIVSTSVFSQTAPDEQSATISTAGNAVAMQKVTASVLVTDIDKATRILTLKNSRDKEFSIVAGPEVRNFDQLKPGDSVHVEFLRSLALSLTKANSTDDISENYLEEYAPPGAVPAHATIRKLSAIAEVVAVDRPGNTITIQGPAGRIVQLDVKNPDHFKVVKVGSRVHVEYTEAVALSVEKSQR